MNEAKHTEANTTAPAPASGRIAAGSVLASAFLLASVANPDTSCRVLAQPTDWSEVRTMRAATGPVSALSVELCVYFEQTVAIENLWLFGPTRWQVSNLGIVIEASFDSSFAPGFELIPPTPIMLPDVNGAVSAFDGLTDFAGSSGQTFHQETQALLTASLQVTDDTFFRSDWPVYIRTRTLPYQQTSASPAMAFQSIALAGGGLVVDYVP